MKKYVVAPRNIHFQILNTYRKQDPFCDIKIYTLEELNRNLYPSFSFDALLYLMKEHHFSYEVSKMYLEILPFIKNDTKNPKLKNLVFIKEELEKKELLISPIKDDELKGKEMEIVGYSDKNNQLLKVLEDLEIKPVFVSNKGKGNITNINIFEKVEDEVYFVLNEIAQLLDDGVDIKDIYIIRRNNEYDYYLKKFAIKFGYHLNIDESVSYYSLGAFKEFKKLYVENKDINLSLNLLKDIMKEDEMYEEIRLRIIENEVDGLDYPLQYDYLINRLKELKIENKKYDKAVKVVNHPIFSLNKHIFVMGFAQGSYPSKVKTNPLLDNETLEEIGLLTSKNKIKEDEDVFSNFLKSENDIHVSFAKKSNSGGYYLSPIAKALNLKEYKPTLGNVFYSKEALKYIYIDLLDGERLYKEKGENLLKINEVLDPEYFTYDNTLIHPPIINNEKTKLKLSYSRLDKYFACHFQYYLDYVVQLDTFTADFNTSIGNIAHKLIEVRNEPNFDFDTRFEEEIALNSEQYAFSTRELFLLRGTLKKQIKNAIEAINLRESFYNKKKSKNPEVFVTTEVKIYPEKALYVSLDENTIIEGRIDNLTVINNEFFVCIDYKTGMSKFNPKDLEYGKSTQLPTYIYLVTESNEFKDLLPGGVYINNLISSSSYPEMEDDLHIYKHLRLNGKTLNNTDFVYAFDQSVAQGNTSFINSLYVKDNSLAGASLIGEETFVEYKDIVMNLFKEMAASLRENKFDIAPRFIKADGPCSWCSYRDICYVKKEQYNVVNDKDVEEEESL